MSQPLKRKNGGGYELQTVASSPGVLSKADALSEAEFRHLMGRLGGFEKHPTLAVGVSGGADSMALSLLAHRWAIRRGGRIVALTVDHALRPGSRSEARLAHRRLKDLGIECKLLVWRGNKPESGIQAAARDARYSLMAEWCRRHGVLHLLIAHHSEDQAETVLDRLGHASGVEGLAGMSAIRELRDIRLLRPCLTVPRDRLRAVLVKRKMDWSEDPSNQNTDYARVRLRVLLPTLAVEGVNSEALSGSARRLATIRAKLERETAAFLGTHATLFPEGYARLDHAAFVAQDPEIAQRAIIAIMTTVGGNIYPPRHASVERLYKSLREGGGKLSGARTLAGCRISASGPDYIICREPQRCQSLVAPQNSSRQWDNRFLIKLPRDTPKGKSMFTIKALGEHGWAAIRTKADHPTLWKSPKPAIFSLPAIYKGRSLVAVPHLKYYKETRFGESDVRFIPAKSITSAGFSVV